MDQRMPFYMVYQTPVFNMDDRMIRRDYDYMKSAYPDTAKRLLPFIEDECDRLEYDGSVIYDEYPDKLQLHLMCRRIYDKAKEKEENPGKWLMDMIQIMAFQELCQRRCEYRKYKKKFY